jgi:hypothetical protein
LLGPCKPLVALEAPVAPGADVEEAACVPGAADSELSAANRLCINCCSAWPTALELEVELAVELELDAAVPPPEEDVSVVPVPPTPIDCRA